MIKDTHPYNISQIFSNEDIVFYMIPKYQRGYTWGQKEWDALFTDIIENENGYFLGSIICVDTSTSAMEKPVLEVIDGQQRITSMSILLIALYEKLCAFKNELDEDGQTDIVNIRRELVAKKDGKTVARLTPQVQNFNREDYFSLLCDKELLEICERKKNAGNRKIYKAYKYFSRLIDKYIEDLSKENDSKTKIDLLFELVKKFNSAVLVLIEVGTHQDAYMLFESLNNRGTPLSAVDLIKNLLISYSDRDNKADETYEKWRKVILLLSEDYNVQERFFRQYYNTFRTELNSPYQATGKTKYPLGYLATKTTLLDIYEKLIKNDYNKLLEDVNNKAKNYSMIINNADDEDIVEELKKPLLNLERIQGAPSYILLLYLFSKKEQLEVDNDLISKVANYLIRFFVRRNITDYPATRNLTKIFMDIVSAIENKKGQEVYDTIINMLKNNSSDDNVFEEKLRGSVYEENPDATRFLLCYYEEKYETKENISDLWKRDNSNKYIWTIEHIFPEGENIPKVWVDMIANGDRELAEDYLNKYVHNLGNLTITGYNQNLSNKSFEEKKNRKDKDGRFIGYRNGLKINSDLIDREKWAIEEICTRTDQLVKVFIDDFKL